MTERIGEMLGWVSLSPIIALVAAIFGALLLSSVVTRRLLLDLVRDSLRGCRGD